LAITKKDTAMKIFILISTLAILSGCRYDKQTGPKETVNNSSSHEANPKQIEKGVIKNIDTVSYIEDNREAGLYAFTSSDLLKSKDLEMVPPSELRLMRNEIFARYGYIFKSKDLKGYFDNTDWYMQFYENVDHLLSEIERENIKLIQKHEKVNKEISPKELFNYYVTKINIGEDHLIPGAIAHKYGLTVFNNFKYYNGIVSVDRQVFNNSKEFIFLIYIRYMGCNECPEQFELRKFDLKGNEIDIWELGNNLETVQMKSDNHLYCFGLEFPYISFDDDTTEIKPEDIDTIRLNIKLTKNGDIYFD
jgi:hypothetical protein